MKFTSIPTPAADAAPNALPSLLLLLLLLQPRAADATLMCNNVAVDRQRYDLSALEGAHSVVVSRDEGASFLNTTYTVDICRSLKRKGDVPKDQQCPDNTRVCAIQRTIGKGENNEGDVIQKAFPIAGELADYGGRNLEYEVTRLTSEDLPGEDNRGGLRLVLNGGFDENPERGGGKRDQKAVITFLCDPDRDGTEGEYEPEDEYDDGNGPFGEKVKEVSRRHGSSLLYREEGEEGDGGDDREVVEPSSEIQLGEGKNASLIFESWGAADESDNVDILHLTWRTKYVCARHAGSGNDDPTGERWGFFTWLVIIVFLSTAAYLIFGSWLNYNRYGARGWDLLPHGDSLRDIPYLLKEWMRRMLNTVQGSGSRGGYSAV